MFFFNAKFLFFRVAALFMKYRWANLYSQYNPDDSIGETSVGSFWLY